MGSVLLCCRMGLTGERWVQESDQAGGACGCPKQACAGRVPADRPWKIECCACWGPGRQACRKCTALYGGVLSGTSESLSGLQCSQGVYIRHALAYRKKWGLTSYAGPGCAICLPKCDALVQYEPCVESSGWLAQDPGASRQRNRHRI